MSDKELEEWLYLAEGDKETANFLQKSDGRTEIIIYHYHQAIEKYFKYLLLINNKQINKTHSLDKLLSDLIQIYPNLLEIKNDILLINSYLPQLRYPYGDRLTIEDELSVQNSFNKTWIIISKYINN